MMFCKYVKHKLELYRRQARVVRMLSTYGADA